MEGVGGVCWRLQKLDEKEKVILDLFLDGGTLISLIDSQSGNGRGDIFRMPE